MLGEMRRGFSLLELSVALLVIVLLTGAMVKFMAPAQQPTTHCYAATQNQLREIRGAVERFARSTNRLPLPAARHVGVDSTLYGREDAAGTNTVQAAGVSFGALPFQALGLDTSYAGDCWGNKLSYAVTTATTAANALPNNVVGNITLKKEGGSTINTHTAYAIISHGQDQLGAVKLNYSAAKANDGPPDSAYRWCAGAATLANTNCRVTTAEVIDAAFNDGKDAGANYFDDVVVASMAPKVLSGGYYAFGWGDNLYAQIGDGYTRHRTSPRLVYGSQLLNSVASGAGGSHSCGLTSTGVAYCWGGNYYGQLGNGSTNGAQPSPVAVNGGLTFSAIVMGQNHTCGLVTTTGIAYCWGHNGFGQLGNGGVGTQQTSPVLVNTALTFTRISAGGNHTCAITATDDAYCWGNNISGQIGNGVAGGSVNTPYGIVGLKFSTIAVGNNHTCGLEAGTGSTYCWGRNTDGQVGKSPTSASEPTPYNVGASFSSISAGSSQTCALNSTGAAYCWGRNSEGAVGNGSTLPATQTSPSAVVGGYVFSSIVSGNSFNCGLTASGTTYCWGRNVEGEVGNGTTSPAVTSPVSIHGGLTFKQITTGQNHACGLTFGGTAHCWGFNSAWGETGDGTASRSYLAKATLGSHDFTFVSSGGNSSCGISSSGVTYCWGLNFSGQLGDGTNINRSTPNPINGGLTFVKLASGLNHHCGLTSAGAAWCWGHNGDGQLGNNSYSPSNVPSAVQGGLTFKELSTGYRHTCGLTTAGAAYCWGTNGNRQLGDGTVAFSRNVPAAVVGGLTFKKISVGYYHTCGISTSNNAYCWGLNLNGQVGDGTIASPKATPTAVGSGPYNDIAAGHFHTCAITTAGAARCWGLNTAGQIGNGGTISPQPSPVTVNGTNIFTSIAAGGDGGGDHSCGITNSNAVYCWGSNIYGQLGDGTTTNRTSPTLVLGTGAGGLSVKSLSVSPFGDSSFMLVEQSNACSLPGGGTAAIGWFNLFYQSTNPVGACASEYRTCNGGTLSGSYTQQTCTSGCDARAEIWNGAVSGCTATVPALAAGGSTTVNDVIGSPQGSITANCSVNGVLTLSSPVCAP